MVRKGHGAMRMVEYILGKCEQFKKDKYRLWGLICISIWKYSKVVHSNLDVMAYISKRLSGTNLFRWRTCSWDLFW